MLNPQSLQLRVGVDVGSQCHSARLVGEMIRQDAMRIR
jgi:hypothetical protein